MAEPTHLLVAGGGPAALEAALAVGRLAGDRVRITLLSDRDHFVYRPGLRAMLLTGARPRYLRHAPRDHGVATEEAPWWPPHRIAGRELAPYLTAHPELLEPI